jgi:hypothetical protein
MSVSEWMQVSTLAIALFSGLGVPFILAALNRQDTRRTQMHESIDGRLSHLDTCIDDLKSKVLGQTCTRADFASFKGEINETMTRMRAAITSESQMLEQRISRVEDQFLRAGRAHGDRNAQ